MTMIEHPQDYPKKPPQTWRAKWLIRWQDGPFGRKRYLKYNTSHD